MKRILALLMVLVLALAAAGCSSVPASGEAGQSGPGTSAGAVKAGSQAPDGSAGGELKYYPTVDQNYKTARNSEFDFWFDIPNDWKALNKSENGGEFTIDPGDGKVALMVYGVLMDGGEDAYYGKLAGKGGSIEDFSFRDSWAGKKVTNGTKLYYVRADGDSYIIFYVNYKDDPAWYDKNKDVLEYIGQSLRTRQESFGSISGDDGITMKDLQLGDIKLNMPYDQVLKLMKSAPGKEEEDEYEGMQAKTLFFGDGTEIYIVDGAVYSVNVISADYPTPRGLKVGDTVSRLKELYGEPDNINDDTHWGYTYEGYELFSVVLEKNKVSEIQIDLVM